MPTKERLAKERARKQEEKRLDEIFGPLAGQLGEVDLTLNEMAIEAARSYTNLGKFDENGEPYRCVLHPEKPSNDKRADERRAEALRLKEKYPEQWSARGGSKYIAIAEGVDMTNANDNPLRKIQKYIEDFP